MTQTEQFALAFFKKYTFLDLKTFRAFSDKVPPKELEILDAAIEMYRIYNSLEIQKTKKTNEHLSKKAAS